jgi:transporter family protein
VKIARGGAGNDGPKVTRWIGPALASALSYALYNLFIKLGSDLIHPALGAVILQIVAATVGCGLLGTSREKQLTYNRKGVLCSIGAGIAVGMAEILSFQVSASGVEASKSIPVMIGVFHRLRSVMCHLPILTRFSCLTCFTGGSIAFGSFLGFAVLRERMTIKGWLGVGLVVLGIFCVATDPGAKMGH